MNHKSALIKDLIFLGLFEKAKEIRFELGEKAVLSYIKSSHRLLSKVYHPDLNPANTESALVAQQKLNRVSQAISNMTDQEIVELFEQPDKKPDKRKKRLLVVEDEFGLQEIFRDIFTMEGYDVRVAIDGDNGYEVYVKFKPDLVFTDVVMPKMSGLDLVRKIRETEPDIKVIYISGFFGIRRLKQQLDEDVALYGYPLLAKPFKTSNMLDIVRNYLDE
ncbi:MAG: response regulator [Deltaproteobacteria bacterium]|nr:response regulator [Deltaproteobacteria bacterium]